MPDPALSPSIALPEEDRRLANPHAMTPQPGFWMRRLARMFERVDFRREAQVEILDAQRRGVPVYILDRRSLLDFMYFNFACLRFGLPLAFFVNGLRTLMLRPILSLIGYVLRRLVGALKTRKRGIELMAHHLRLGRPSLLFLRRRRGLSFSGVTVLPYLKALIRLQRELDRPLVLLPLLLVWTQQPDRYRRSLKDFVFGDPYAPGRIRKMLGFFRNYRHAFVQRADPFDLKVFIAENPDEHDEEQLAHRLRWALHHRMNLEARNIRGPVLKAGRQLRQEILNAETTRKRLGQLASEHHRPLPSVQRDMRRQLKEIAADFSGRMLEAVVLTLTFIWNRIYAAIEVDPEGMRRLRDAGRQAPLIFVPAHRSHVDYLAISYLLYTHGLLPPHITAGINLSFWPLGAIFRRCGAFFIRRRFKGDPVYGLSLAAYLHKLVQEGYWLEFFIEGTRSRTGKSLPPKFGILSLIVDAVLDGAAPDVYFVPCTVGYERLIEERSYIQELSGKEKEAENIAGLLRTGKVLASKYGGLFTRFGQPISLAQFVRDAGGSDRLSDKEARRRLVARLGYKIVHGINGSMVITPSALVAEVLLGHPRPGISRERLIRRVGFLLGLILQRGAPLSQEIRRGLSARRVGIERVTAEVDATVNDDEPPFARAKGTDSARGEAVREAIDRVLDTFEKHKLIRLHRYEDEQVYTAVPERRINLDIYKNCMVHVLVPEAIVAAALLAHVRDRLVSRAAVRQDAKVLSRLLRHEFIFDPDSPFDEVLARTWQEFVQVGLIEPCPDGTLARIHPSASMLLEFLRNAVAPLLESYGAVLQVLANLPAEGETERDLIKRIQRRADRLYQVGELHFPEAISSQNFTNALRLFREHGLVEQRDDASSGRPRLFLQRPQRVCQHWGRAISRFLRGLTVRGA